MYYGPPKKVYLEGLKKSVGTGWLPPMPKLKDYTTGHQEVKKMLDKLAAREKNKSSLTSVDLRQYCSPIENQGQLGSCSAHAGAGIVEYFERRAFGKHIDASRLFIYKTTRNLMAVTGDTGAWTRNVMAALTLCGAPDEKYWPYVVEDFDNEPSSFAYAVADNYEALTYFCHDPFGVVNDVENTLKSVKSSLALGVPSMFGFYGFDSFEQTDTPGGVPYPLDNEEAKWGHAVVAVGYDDKKKIKNTKSGKTATGALLFRNSWGVEWGEQGYGWIPYDYVRHDLAWDFWSLLSMKWVDTAPFGLDAK